MQDASEQGVGIELDALRIGLGYNHALSNRADFVARAAYERAEADVTVAGFGSADGDADGDADGYSLEAGFRGLLSLDGDIEGWVMGGYADMDSAEVDGISLDLDEDEDDQFYGRVGMQAKFSPTWGVVGEGRFSGDANEFFLGLRASF